MKTFHKKITAIVTVILLTLLVLSLFSPKVYIKKGDYYTHFILIEDEFNYLRIMNNCKDGLIKNSAGESVKCDRYHSLKREILEAAESDKLIFGAIGLKPEEYDTVWDLYQEDQTGPKLTLALSDTSAHFDSISGFTRANKLSSWQTWFLIKTQFALN